VTTPAAIVLIVVVATVLAAGTWFYLRRRRRLAELALLSPGQRERHDACVRADKELAAADKAYRAAVKAAEKRCHKESQPQVLIACGDALLTEREIILNGVYRPLRPGIRAQVDATGDVHRYSTSRSTATRMLTGGALLGPAGVVAGAAARKTSVHTVDSRQLYITVTGPDWQDVVRIDPNLGPRARAFSAGVFTASEHWDQFEAQHRVRRAQAEKHLADVVGNDQRLREAQLVRRVLEMDPLEVLRADRKAGRLPIR
jgi:hypothetical protein